MAFPITLKPLRGKIFKVTSEPGETIRDLKGKVAEHGSDFPEALQQLIYRGKILKDSDAVLDLGIKPNQVIVVMLTKAKPKQNPSANGSATMQTPVNRPTLPAVVPAVAEPAASPQIAPDTRAVMEEVPQSAEGSPGSVPRGVSAAEGEAVLVAPQVASLVAPPAASFVTPPVAQPAPTVVPPDAPVTAPPDVEVARRVQPFPSTDAIIADAATERAARPLPPLLEDLRRNPHFASTARMLLQEPQALRYLLPSVLQGNPDLVQAIQDNFPAFLQMLQEVGSRPRLCDGNWDELLATNPELLEEMLPEIEAQDFEMAEAIRSDPAAFLAAFQRPR